MKSPLHRALLALLLVAAVWAAACAASRQLRTPAPDLWVDLRWVHGHPGETREDVAIGVAWSLYFLGARLPEGSLSHALVWTDDKHLRLNLSAVGFDATAQQALGELWRVLEASEEFRVHGGVDIGRFVALTLNSTPHYYRITGARPRYEDFRRGFRFERRRAHVLDSSVALGHRAIEISAAGAGLQPAAFVALEGSGSLTDGSFAVEEFEVIDFMPNGQLRFALYDRAGRLKTSADPKLTQAGKPAKCLWCHETALLPPMRTWPAQGGSYSSAEFSARIVELMRLLTEERRRVRSDVDVAEHRPEHSKAEFLYLSFMEPSAARLAEEWGVALGDAETRLAGLPTHPQHEFAFLGKELYDRRYVDGLGPYTNLRPPDDAREPGYEPNLIGN